MGFAFSRSSARGRERERERWAVSLPVQYLHEDSLTLPLEALLHLLADGTNLFAGHLQQDLGERLAHEQHLQGHELVTFSGRPFRPESEIHLPLPPECVSSVQEPLPAARLHPLPRY